MLTHAGTRRPWVVLALLLGLMAVGATAPWAQSQEGYDEAPPTIGAEVSFDDKLARVASNVPAFAGFTLTEDSDKTMRMTILASSSDAAVTGQVRKELAREFGDTFGATRFDLKRVDFSFVELKEWDDKLRTAALALNGVVHFDLDERKNRLSVGVEDVSRTGPAVYEEAAARRIPQAAVVVEQVPPVSQELRNRRRPFPGGLQIEWLNDNDGFIYICSLGFNAKRLGTQGFITNSHCSTTQGGVDEETYFQANWGLFFVDEIGSETVDPALRTGTANSCPSGRRCRWSDANFSRPGCAAIDVCDATPRHGFIARVAVGSSSWNGSDTYRITNSGFPAEGATVQKTGRTTGRTTGTVSRTCVDVNVSGTNITMKCQAQAGYSSSGGDSGGPVFRVTNSPSTFDVNLVGIHWGSSGTFSPFPNLVIAGELGNGSSNSLTVCAAGFSC